MRISVFESRELQALIIVMKGLPREIAKQVRRQSRQVIEPEWRKALAEEAGDYRPGQRLFAQTGRVAVSDQNVTLKAATIGRGLSGGLGPSEWHAIEFGGDRDVSPHLRPRRRKGYVVFPAAAQIIPRIAALWAQTTVRTIHEEVESIG